MVYGIIFHLMKFYTVQKLKFQQNGLEEGENWEKNTLVSSHVTEMTKTT